MSLLSWIGLVNDSEPLEVGMEAPDAVVQDTHGAPIHLHAFYKQGLTLVYFFPKAGTPGCSKQACSLRDDFENLKQRGVEIVGISSDQPEAQRLFQEKHRLPFTLLADPERKAAQAYGVPMLLGMFRRQSFLLESRRVVWRDLEASTGDQASDVLKMLNAR